MANSARVKWWPVLTSSVAGIPSGRTARMHPTCRDRRRGAHQIVPTGRLYACGARAPRSVPRSGAERAGVAAREDVHHLLLEVVDLVAHAWVDALLVHLARAVDVVLQARVDVELAAALLALLFVVELDLGDQQSGEAPRLLVQRRGFLAHRSHRGGSRG